jgi:hypothetical protein
MKDLQKSFSVDYYSEAKDQRYAGRFTVKKLTIGDLSRLGSRKAQLCGGMSYDPETSKGIDPGTAMLNEMIAHCEIALVDKPEWFDAEKIIDVGLLNAVYEEVASFEANFLARPKVKREEPDRSVEVSGGVEPSGEGGTSHSFEDVVDRKIPKISPLA